MLHEDLDLFDKPEANGDIFKQWNEKTKDIKLGYLDCRYFIFADQAYYKGHFITRIYNRLYLFTKLTFFRMLLQLSNQNIALTLFQFIRIKFLVQTT